MAALVALTTGSSNVAAADESCAVSDVEYAIVGSLFVKDTQFGAANGRYPLGAGRMRVRFESRPDSAPAHVKLMSYELDNHLTIKASFASWWTRVETRSRTFAAESCRGAAQGELRGGDVVWSTPVAGYHSDGSMECEGNVCGKYFKPFHFAPDGKTFTMGVQQGVALGLPKTDQLRVAGGPRDEARLREQCACLLVGEVRH
jgi:hypothetical protein